MKAEEAWEPPSFEFTYEPINVLCACIMLIGKAENSHFGGEIKFNNYIQVITRSMFCLLSRIIKFPGFTSIE